MRIIGGYQNGRDQQRDVLIEPGDVGKTFEVDAEITGDSGEEGIDLRVYGPEIDGRQTRVDDPVARDEAPEPGLAELGKAVDTPEETWVRALRPGETILERVRGPQAPVDSSLLAGFLHLSARAKPSPPAGCPKPVAG